mgnify:CR=1 FL=1
MSKLFIEKYKPHKIDDLILDDTVCIKIKQIIKLKKITNLILTGDTGVGKTATIGCIVKSLYTKKYYDNILELNACDERGIKFVHETITNFCKTVANYDPDGTHHKLLILDEANNLTLKAQKIIGFIMEKYKNTKFIFTCNNTFDIIDSIQSRCLTITLNNIPEHKSIKKFEFICKTENIIYSHEALIYLYNKCQQDIRKTINMIELIHKSNVDLTIQNINIIYNLPSIEAVEDLIIKNIKKNIKETMTIVKQFNENGYYPTDILLYIIDHLKNKQIDNTLKNEDIRILIIETLIECSYIMSTTSPSYLHITCYILKCIDKMKEKEKD